MYDRVSSRIVKNCAKFVCLDTLILQLGCILQSVQAWKRVYKLRVLVFVEYEDEVEAERARVEGLLEKLRIEAEVVVFWLASGSLATYETIVSGHAPNPAADTLVNGCLQDEEWWDELQSLRNRPNYWSASQELDSLANVVELTAGRPGIFNPHNDSEGLGGRRRSIARLAEFPKNPTVSTLARLGVNMGIHTANLLPSVFHSSSESNSDSESESDSDSSEDDRNLDFNEDASAASEGDIEVFEPVRRPLLSTTRRKSHNDAHILEPAARHKPIEPERFVKTPGSTANRSYGTMTPLLGENKDESYVASLDTSFEPPSATNTSLSDVRRPATPRRGLSRNTSKEQLNQEVYAPKPKRSALSRQSSHLRFSQLLMTSEEAEEEEETSPMLKSAESDNVKARPGLSRASSQARFSSRLLPETRVTTEADGGPSVSFAPEPETRPQTMPPSPGEGPVDFSINIPDLLASYQVTGDLENNGSNGSSGDASSLPLSFNDLPARAQYLILNELLRQNSSDSAVIFTTLPIPTEGTCKSEEASVQYLSDMEVLCNELPPVMLVLSNNMT